MAAKVIRLSDDDGATWENLPGSEGSFNVDAEGIDDTILGQTYQSNEVGLVEWGVSANGIWKGFAGYLAELKKIGTATGMTAESMTLVSGKTYAIDDATKEIWDRSAGTFDILDNAASVAAADILNVDYLFGRVTFVASYTPTTPITVTGDFFPTAAIGRANTYSLSMTAEQIDGTDFAVAQANSGTKIFTPGLRTVALELGGIFDDVENAKADVTARTELIIEVDPAGDGSSIARGFFKLATASQAGAVGALEEETMNFVLTVPDETTNPAVELPFNWRHTATTMSQSLQFAITSFLAEDNTVEVQYLPQGTPGQSPLDAIQGDVMFSDISLSGGLSNMNVFTMEMQGTDEFTIV
ncbi:MAG: hypothetical protein V3S69_07315 [Dehalococcoidales bacterium]